MERMVVLAKSIKNGNYCLAGKALDDEGYVGPWVRPVSSGIGGGIPLTQTFCADGEPAEVLDVVSVQWGAVQPERHQRENRRFGTAPWERCGHLSWSDLPVLADEVPSALWLDGLSSRCGLNDRVSACSLHALEGSLYLVEVTELLLYRTRGFEGQVKFRADFRIGPQRYNLALTDLVARGWLSQSPQLEVAEAYVCVSLAVPFHDGFAYKVVAAVITSERAGGMQ